MKIIPTYCCGRRGPRCVLCPVVANRERKIAQVTNHTDPAWLAEALWSADQVMWNQDLLTTDDIWIDLERRGVPAPREPRCMTYPVGILTREGSMEWTKEYTTSRIPRGNGRTIKIYRVVGYAPSR